MSIYDNGMYDSLRPHVYKLERFDENVFDIFAGLIQFYSCNTPWQIPNEAFPVITEIQKKSQEIEDFCCKKEQRMNLTKVSKYISLILRHKPEEIGIELDKCGWVNIDELVKGVSKNYPGFNTDILKEIVATDEKQRYSFNKDCTKVRANQGHSIPVDLGLEPVIPPACLYHGSAVKYMDSISNSGLVAKNRQYVHLSGDISTAIKVGKRHGKLVLYGVHSGKMHLDGFTFYRSVNGVWLTDHVPQKYLKTLLVVDDLVPEEEQ